MMQLRLSIGILAEFTRPRNHLIYELLLRRLLGWERPQYTQQLPFILRIHAPLRLLEYIDEVAS